MLCLFLTAVFLEQKMPLSSTFKTDTPSGASEDSKHPNQETPAKEPSPGDLKVEQAKQDTAKAAASAKEAAILKSRELKESAGKQAEAIKQGAKEMAAAAQVKATEVAASITKTTSGLTKK